MLLAKCARPLYGLDMGKDNVVEQIASFETNPTQYRHWKLSFDKQVATLSMDVKEDGGLRDDYTLTQRERFRQNAYEEFVSLFFLNIR
jgi:hypothetical protein